jgi:hypothetical protein
MTTGRQPTRPSAADVYWEEKTCLTEVIRPGAALWAVMIVALAVI